MTYSVIVFLHIIGALGLFAGIGLEQVSLAKLRRGHTVAQAREWVALLGTLRRVDGPSGLLILATGVYMVAVRWGGQGWIGVSLLAMVLMAFLSIALTGRRANAIRKILPAVDAPISASLRQHLNDPALRASAILRVSLGVGIVFNMSAKPATVGALIVIGVALACGAVLASIARIGVGPPTAAGAVP